MDAIGTPHTTKDDFVMSGSLLPTLAIGAVLLSACSNREPPRQQGQPPQARPSAEVMEKVRACAAAKGVEMPAPPAQGGGRPETAPPRMTEEQRAVLDACFKEQGIAQPQGGPPPRR